MNELFKFKNISILLTILLSPLTYLYCNDTTYYLKRIQKIKQEIKKEKTLQNYKSKLFQKNETLKNELLYIIRTYKKTENRKEGYDIELIENSLEIILEKNINNLSKEDCEELIELIGDKNRNDETKILAYKVLYLQNLSKNKINEIIRFLFLKISELENTISKLDNPLILHYKEEILKEFKFLLTSFQNKK